MDEVSTANAVNEPGRVGRWGVGKPAAQSPALPWLRSAALVGAALADNPNLSAA